VNTADGSSVVKLQSPDGCTVASAAADETLLPRFSKLSFNFLIEREHYEFIFSY
jgi:hypothetical protein